MVATGGAVVVVVVATLARVVDALVFFDDEHPAAPATVSTARAIAARCTRASLPVRGARRS